ncbi:MAG TPA: helix-turn-helix domain-containing protein [Chloroflexia bacterium]|nr:helix-turn-helix domain-containing protein [Chloroflexia bacterium]
MQALFTPEEAADALGMGKNAVRELLKCGVLKGNKAGRYRAWRISRESLETFADWLDAYLEAEDKKQLNDIFQPDFARHLRMERKQRRESFYRRKFSNTDS